MASSLAFVSCNEDDYMALPAADQIEQYLTDNNITDEQTTSSGLVYIIEEAGASEKPTLNDEITIHYTGFRANGEIFDETAGTAISFPLRNLILAWQEGIQLIGKGGKIKLICPPNLAFGDNPPSGSIIKPGDVLVFDIELEDFSGNQIEQYLTDNNITGEQTTSSGLVYIIEEAGASEKPTLNDEITIHYSGYRTDGEVFDETTGTARTFPLQNLILGWQEGLQLIGSGGKIKLICPPSLAYGNNPPSGSIIQAGDVLVFDIELVSFTQ